MYMYIYMHKYNELMFVENEHDDGDEGYTEFDTN